MAYRQLFAITLAAGLGLAACGGETGSGQLSGDPGASQPPGNPDRPNNDTDQPPASSDRPPSGADKPPGSADEPAGTGNGGQLGALCTQFCAVIDQVVAECGMNGDDVPMDGLCSEELDCSQIPSTPCDSQSAALLGCFIQVLGGICQSAAGGEEPNIDDLCTSETQAVQACAEANGLDDDDMSGPGDGNGPGDPPPQSCTPGGGCACADACQRCVCQAGTDVARQQACVMTGGACAP